MGRGQSFDDCTFRRCEPCLLSPPLPAFEIYVGAFYWSDSSTVGCDCMDLRYAAGFVRCKVVVLSRRWMDWGTLSVISLGADLLM